MKKFWLILIISCMSIYAQDAGKTGFPVLKFPAGARTAAMGNSGLSTAGDVSAVFNNPAVVNDASVSELFLFHNQWIEDVSADMFAARSTFWGITWGTGIAYSSVRGIEIREKAGDPLGEFNAHTMNALVSAAFSPAENWSAGINIKYLYEEYFVDQAEGFAFDFGVSYGDGKTDYRYSFLINNLGSLNNLRNEATVLPAAAGLGISRQWNSVFASIDIGAAAEIHQGLNSGIFELRSGVEVIYNSMFALRTGIAPMHETSKFTAGLGIIYNNLNFDYAFLPFSDGLGSGHLVSLNFVF